jgi:hypothetical protein
VLAALAVSRWLENKTGWSIRRFVKTAAVTAPSRSRPARTSSPSPRYPTTFVRHSTTATDRAVRTNVAQPRSQAPSRTPSASACSYTDTHHGAGDRLTIWPSLTRTGQAGPPRERTTTHLHSKDLLHLIVQAHATGADYTQPAIPRGASLSPCKRRPLRPSCHGRRADERTIAIETEILDCGREWALPPYLGRQETPQGELTETVDLAEIDLAATMRRIKQLAKT